MPKPLTKIGLIEVLLGRDRFAALPAEVRRLHGTATGSYTGSAKIGRGNSLLSRFCAAVAGLPGATDTAHAQVDIATSTQAGAQTWTRTFVDQRGKAHVMRSKLWADQGLLLERLGLVCFGFALSTDTMGFNWRVKQVHALGIPLPARLFSGVSARSFSDATGYRFEVNASLPLAGLIISYHGHLA